MEKTGNMLRPMKKLKAVVVHVDSAVLAVAPLASHIKNTLERDLEMKIFLTFSETCLEEDLDSKVLIGQDNLEVKTIMPHSHFLIEMSILHRNKSSLSMGRT